MGETAKEKKDKAEPAHRALESIVLVTGKGGVGKTTVASGLAKAAADRDGKAVLLEFVDAESGKRVLGKDPRVESVVVKPHEAIERMSAELFHSTLLAKVVIGNFAMKRLFRAAPALRELAQLDAILRASRERPGVRIVVDMPATGHGVAWLRVPRQLADLLRTGPLHAVAARLDRELVAKGRASVVIVTLPEELVLRETIELCHSMRREVGLEPARLIVNQVPRALPAHAAGEALRLASTANGAVAAAAHSLAEVAAARAQSRGEALETLKRASEIEVSHPILLPLAPADPTAAEVAAWLVAEGAA